MSAAAVIAQDPTLTLPVRLVDPTNTQHIDGGFPQETGRSDETLAPSPTTASGFDSFSLAPAIRADGPTLPLAWPPLPRSTSSTPPPYVTFGWISANEGTDFRPIWAPLTYYTQYTTYTTSGNFFERCTSYDWASILNRTTCVPTYTECGGGWIRGPSTSAPCNTAKPTNNFQTQYSCVTDLFYFVYGAWNGPLSSIRCGGVSYHDGYPTKIFGVSPTVRPTYDPPSYSTPTSSSGSPRASRDESIGVIIGATLGSMAAVLILILFILNKRRKRQKASLSAAALNGDAEATTAVDSESPPKYTAPGTDPVAAPAPAVLPTRRIGDDDASVCSTEPPPYTP